MDALLRLRVLIWVLVIALWGVMVYQYLGEEEKESARMKPVVNPYSAVTVAETTPAPDAVEPNAPAAAPGLTAAAGGPVGASPAAVPTLVVPHGSADPAAIVTPAPGAVAPAPSDDRTRDESVAAAPPPEPKRAPARRVAKATRPERRQWREDRSMQVPDPPVPPGFVKSATRHFNVYAEQYPASDRFLELLENLHANLMLDLAPFSPWASDQKVSVFLFKNQDTYRRVTGRPPWSGGASSVPKRKVFLYESEELPGILAHELTHIYFDGFFIDGTNDPLWLSEGMATLVQVERGLAAPNWLRENLRELEGGAGLPLESFMEVRSTSGWDDAKVRLWYAQAFSVVRYLIRTQYRASFYKFSSYLRDGRPAAEALYRAYGAPYTRVRALEIAWRHEISRGADTRGAVER